MPNSFNLKKLKKLKKKPLRVPKDIDYGDGPTVPTVMPTHPPRGTAEQIYRYQFNFKRASEDLFEDHDFIDDGTYYDEEDESVTLYHGTIRDNYQSIKDHGIVPSVGNFVNKFYDDDREKEELVFMAEKESLRSALNAILFQVGHKLGKTLWDVDLKDIRDHGLLAVIEPDKENMRKLDSQYRETDLDGNVESHDYPSTVESRDVFSRESVEPTYYLVGTQLVQFILENNLLGVRETKLLKAFNLKEMRLAKEELDGGMADGKSDKEFDKRQLQKGVKTEMEHTNDKKKAKEIAKDHLTEDKKYYNHLEEMEKKFEKKAKILRDVTLARKGKESWTLGIGEGDTFASIFLYDNELYDFGKKDNGKFDVDIYPDKYDELMDKYNEKLELKKAKKPENIFPPKKEEAVQPDMFNDLTRYYNMLESSVNRRYLYGLMKAGAKQNEKTN